MIIYEYLVIDNGNYKIHLSDYILIIGEDIGNNIIVLKKLREL